MASTAAVLFHATLPGQPFNARCAAAAAAAAAAAVARNVAFDRNRTENSTQARIRLQGSNGSRMRIKDGDHLYGAWQVQARVTGAPGAVTAFYLRYLQQFQDFRLFEVQRCMLSDAMT
jgi:hypothetical protein